MSSKLGTAKVYFKKEDLGKMLKLHDIDNLMITDVDINNANGEISITITTPIDNATNDRVKTGQKYPDKQRINLREDVNKALYTIETNSFGRKGVIDSDYFPDDYLLIKNLSGKVEAMVKQKDVKIVNSII